MKPPWKAREFGSDVRRFRESRDQSQRDAAAESGVAFATLGRIERAESGRVAFINVVAVARWAGLDIADYLQE